MPDPILDISRIPQFQLQWFQEIETIWDELEAAVNSTDARLDALEAESREIKVTYFDPITIALPTGAAVTLDGNPGQNGDLVLFSRLVTGNNKIYRLGGVGSSITWTPVAFFGENSQEVLPSDGDTARVLKGDFYKEQLAVFDGTTWKINESMRFFNGFDYWEMSSLQTTEIIDNSTNEVFSVTASGSEHITVNYSILRGTYHETGILLISSDSVSEVAIAEAFASPSNTGVSFSGTISGGDLILSYTADSRSLDGILKYYITRWSNSVGGPSGIPTYSHVGGALVDAAGVTGDVQYNYGNNLSASTKFKWDFIQNAINLDGLYIYTLSPLITILDDQPDPGTILLTYPKLDNEFCIIEYSINRNDQCQVGRMQVVHNDVNVAITNEFAQTSLYVGVEFSAELDANNVIIKYTSTSIGQLGYFRHATRRWTN